MCLRQAWLFLDLEGPLYAPDVQQVQIHLTAGYIMPYPMEDEEIERSLRGAARKGEYPREGAFTNAVQTDAQC